MPPACIRPAWSLRGRKFPTASRTHGAPCPLTLVIVRVVLVLALVAAAKLEEGAAACAVRHRPPQLLAAQGATGAALLQSCCHTAANSNRLHCCWPPGVVLRGEAVKRPGGEYVLVDRNTRMFATVCRVVFRPHPQGHLVSWRQRSSGGEGKAISSNSGPKLLPMEACGVVPSCPAFCCSPAA